MERLVSGWHCEVTYIKMRVANSTPSATLNAWKVWMISRLHKTYLTQHAAHVATSQLARAKRRPTPCMIVSCGELDR